MDQYDFESILSLDGLGDVEVSQCAGGSFYPDGSVQIVYKGIPADGMVDAIAWLRANRLVVEDKEISGVKLEGKWRTLEIKEQAIESGGVRAGSALVQFVARGIYGEIDWMSARIISGSGFRTNTTAPGDSDAPADPNANAKSDLYRRTAILQLPYIDPRRLVELANSIDVTTSFTDLVVGDTRENGVPCRFDGTWFNTGTSHKQEEDGSGSIYIQLSQPRFTTVSYEGHGTFSPSETYRCSGVPIGLVDGILAEWKTLGAGVRYGASANVSQGDGTCDIILTHEKPAATSDVTRRVDSNYFGITTTDEDINQAAAATEPTLTLTTGTRKTVSNEKTQLGKYNITTIEEVGAQRLLKHDDPGLYGIGYTWKGRNFIMGTTIVVAAGGGTITLYNRSPALTGTSQGSAIETITISATDVSYGWRVTIAENELGLVDFTIIKEALQTIPPATGEAGKIYWYEVIPTGVKQVFGGGGLSLSWASFQRRKHERATFATEADAIEWISDFPDGSWRQVGRVYVADRVAHIEEWVIDPGGPLPSWHDGLGHVYGET